MKRTNKSGTKPKVTPQSERRYTFDQHALGLAIMAKMNATRVPYARGKTGPLYAKLACAQVGISEGTFSMIRSGERAPRVDTLAKLCTWLNRPPQDFFRRVGAPIPTR